MQTIVTIVTIVIVQFGDMPNAACCSIPDFLGVCTYVRSYGVECAWLLC